METAEGGGAVPLQPANFSSDRTEKITSLGTRAQLRPMSFSSAVPFFHPLFERVYLVQERKGRCLIAVDTAAMRGK
jgi:hypothetical protein